MRKHSFSVITTAIFIGLTAMPFLRCGNPVKPEPPDDKTKPAATYPYASSLAVYGDYLYVACQRLNDLLEPADTSLIAVIDTRTDAIVASVKLNKKNPSSMDVFENRLLVSSSGNWFDASTSGVEMIDLASNENLGLIADGSAFGGAVGNVVFVSQSKAYAAAMTENWTTDIIEFNPAAKTVGAKINGISDGSGGLVWDGSKIYAGDRGFGTAGVAVVDPATNTVEQTVATEMPPSSLAIIFSSGVARGIAATTAASDYSAANFEFISADDYSVRPNIIPGLFTDNTVRAFGDAVYILERYGKDNVIKYNAIKTAVEYQISIGEGLNIQDIAVVSETKAYISCHQSRDLIVFDPKTGKRVSTIDLSRFNARAGSGSL
jgi:DNA-binding beta-propeller fold protein YncE